MNVYVASGSGMSSSSSSLSSNSGTNSGSAGTSSGLTFEEEPSDGYIVRSKSAILRCKTLNALNAWFKCNTGELQSCCTCFNEYHINYITLHTCTSTSTSDIPTL